MMSENKEQALADFQSITGIEDVGECLMHLEASNWNLIDAINTVMPTESQTLPSERMEVPMDIIEGASGSDAFQSSISSRIMNSVLSMPMIHDPLPSRLLNFSVQYKENTVPLEVPETETIASIKTALHVELGVPTCQQELSGFNSSVESRDSNQISDDTILSSLHLPQSTNLFLRAPDHPNNFSDGSSYRDRLNTSFRLHIIDITNNKEYNLQFSGSKTVLEVKLGLRDITNIPVRFQRWVGWPDSLKDDYTKIAVLDIPVNGLELILSREETARSKKQLVVELTSSESDNEFEDAAECFGVDDEMFASSSTRRIQPLMPEGVTDETSAVSHFDTEFTHRYGALHPTFEGNLAEALQASCHKTAKERRPLAIYLHHDASVLTNVFCTQLLCSETVASYLALNFVTWAWDITFECNKTFLLAVLSQHLGLGAANTVKNLTLNSLPAVIVITKVRSIPEILNVIPGNVGLDDLMTSLVHAVEVFNSEIQSEIWEEGEREAREQVKREQDAAYEASLLADRAKEEAKRQEFEEKKKQSQQELMKQEELEQQRQHEEAIKDAVRRSLAEQLPAEPSANSTQPVSHIRIRLPDGEALSRSFLANTSLSLLLTYIASEGYPIEEYKVLASWPRIDLTTVDGKKTLEDLKLYPKETLTLEQR